jgi:hypothetical protein
MDASTLSGVSDLDRLILQASDLISMACDVPTAGVVPPTLLSEDIVETFRRNRRRMASAAPYQDNQRESSIYLSRYPVSAIASIAEDDETLAPDDFELRASEGRIVRLSGGAETPWVGAKIVVAYSAGYSSVPEALKLAAITLVKLKASELNRDPLLRGETYEGLGSAQYFQSGAIAGGALPPGIADMLAHFRYRTA